MLPCMQPTNSKMLTFSTTKHADKKHKTKQGTTSKKRPQHNQHILCNRSFERTVKVSLKLSLIVPVILKS